jgi:anti-sigma regulatory factor (Ser/Thr protein kinase)
MALSTLSTVARLTIPAAPRNLATCRLALAALGSALPLGDRGLDDLKLITSEVCSNAIAHGYGGGEGEIDLEFRVSHEEIEVMVSDRGRGFDREAADLTPGVGLTLLSKLCTRHQITSKLEHGTTVVFAYPLQVA